MFTPRRHAGSAAVPPSRVALLALLAERECTRKHGCWCTGHACLYQVSKGVCTMHAPVHLNSCMTSALAGCSQAAPYLDEVFQGCVGLLEQRRKAPAACSPSTCMLTSCFSTSMTPCADALAAFTQRTIAPHRRPAAIGLHLRALRMQSVGVCPSLRHAEEQSLAHPPPAGCHSACAPAAVCPARQRRPVGQQAAPTHASSCSFSTCTCGTRKLVAWQTGLGMTPCTPEQGDGNPQPQ